VTDLPQEAKLQGVFPRGAQNEWGPLIRSWDSALGPKSPQPSDILLFVLLQPCLLNLHPFSLTVA
jgi:hypothetical protein